jgi:hypothetical protein
VAFLGAEIPAITSLTEVENLYRNRAEAVLTYDDHGRGFKTYNFETNKGKDKLKMTRQNYQSAGQEIAERARAYADATGTSIANATRHVMHTEPQLAAAWLKNPHATAATDADGHDYEQNDRDLSGAPKVVVTINNLIAGLPRGPGGRRETADSDVLDLILTHTAPTDRALAAAWKIDRLARGWISERALSGQISEHYKAALSNARSENQELAQMESTGEVSIQGLISLLPKGEQMLSDNY